MHFDFVIPVANSMEPHLKEIARRQKDGQMRGGALHKDLLVLEKQVEKAGKRSQAELLQEMTKFNQKKDEVDKEKAKILEDTLLFERSRFIFLIEAFLKVTREQGNLGSLLSAINTCVPL